MDYNDLNDLDDLYELHEAVTSDERLVRLYNVLIVRMQREVAGLPVPTLAYVFIERIALNYIVMRERERTGRGFGTVASQKSFNVFWLQLTQEFNKMIFAADQKAHQRMLENVVNIIMPILDSVKDDDLRSKLVSQIASAFEEAGIN